MEFDSIFRGIWGVCSVLKKPKYIQARVGGGPWRLVPVTREDELRRKEIDEEIARIIVGAYRKLREENTK